MSNRIVNLISSTRDNEIINFLQSDLERGIDLIYSYYKIDFCSWIISKFNVAKEEAEEIFQASLLALIENLKSGKLSSFSSSLKTYLFSIGKNKCLDYLKKKKRYTVFSFYKFVLYDDGDQELIRKKEFEDKLNLVLEILEEIGPPCYVLLSMFYYENKNWASIANALGYKDEHSARSMKYKCIQKIRKLIRIRETGK